MNGGGKQLSERAAADAVLRGYGAPSLALAEHDVAAVDLDGGNLAV